jgi:hypothetical protein
MLALRIEHAMIMSGRLFQLDNTAESLECLLKLLGILLGDVLLENLGKRLNKLLRLYTWTKR